MKNEKKNQDISVETSKPRKKPGRQPMTPEEKAAAAKIRAEEKAKADNLKADVLVQYQESEIPLEVLIDAAKDDFHRAKKRTLITAMKLYIKPEEHMAYYVINERYEGKVPF